jgi:hypothetical protein
MFGGVARLIVALRLVRRQGQNWTREVGDHPANVLEILRASFDSEIGLNSTLGRLGAANLKLCANLAAVEALRTRSCIPF